jgi:hypothetical protein
LWKTLRVRWLNLVAIAGAYAAVLAGLPGASSSYRAAAAGGALVLLAAIALTVSAGARRAALAPLGAAGRRPVVRGALAVGPWLVLFILVARQGLWWTQRPPALRLFAEYALLNWSVLCCLAARAATATSRPTQARESTQGLDRALLAVFALLAALGVQGSAFGLSSFGAALSTLLAAAGAFALVVWSTGQRAAGLALLASTLATGLGLAVAEGALRLLHVGEAVQETDSREHARQFYRLTPPGAAFVNQPTVLDEFGPALIEINSLGIRGPELAEPRADVLLIGDSFVEARQLPWEQTIGPELQRQLDAGARDLRVVAHGMRGWSPLLEWNWYLKVGRQLRPRLVVLFFFWNDLWTTGDEATTFRAVMTADARPDYFDVPVDPPWIWYAHVRLARLTEEVWRRAGIADLRRAFSMLSATAGADAALDEASAEALARRLAEAPPLSSAEADRLLSSRPEELPEALRRVASTSFWPAMRPMTLWTGAQRRAADRAEQVLRRFAADVRADDARLAIVYVPNPYQVSRRECSVGRLVEGVGHDVLLPVDSGVQTWLRELTARLGIPLLDPTGAMRAFDDEPPEGEFSPLYLRADCHWSPRGHQFVAEHLTRAISQWDDALQVLGRFR